MVSTHMALARKCKFTGFFLNISFVYAYDIMFFFVNYLGVYRVDKFDKKNNTIHIVNLNNRKDTKPI